MKLSEEVKNKIIEEYKSFEEGQYAGKSKEERQKLGQFYTPPELTIKMLEKYDDLEGTILDPTCGACGLLAAAIIAGADPKKCYGIELDKDILEKVARPRMEKLGVPKENIHLGNALNPDCYDHFDSTYSFNPDLGVNGTVTVNNKKVFRFGGLNV